LTGGLGNKNGIPSPQVFCSASRFGRLSRENGCLYVPQDTSEPRFCQFPDAKGIDDHLEMLRSGGTTLRCADRGNRKLFRTANSAGLISALFVALSTVTACTKPLWPAAFIRERREKRNLILCVSNTWIPRFSNFRSSSYN